MLSTLLVPQGMAYAEVAGLPPIIGLYTSITCLLDYAVFGPSRILVPASRFFPSVRAAEDAFRAGGAPDVPTPGGSDG